LKILFISWLEQVQKRRLTFTVWDDLAGSSFLPKPDDNFKKSGKQREVEIIAIDDLIDSSKYLYRINKTRYTGF